MKIKRDEVIFSVTFDKLGSLGSPMVMLDNVPAYAFYTREHRPQVGETWYVQIKHRSTNAIFLRPIRKWIPTEEFKKQK